MARAHGARAQMALAFEPVYGPAPATGYPSQSRPATATGFASGCRFRATLSRLSGKTCLKVSNPAKV